MTISEVLALKSRLEAETGVTVRHVYVSPRDQASLLTNDFVAFMPGPLTPLEPYQAGKFATLHDLSWWLDQELPSGDIRFTE